MACIDHPGFFDQRDPIESLILLLNSSIRREAIYCVLAQFHVSRKTCGSQSSPLALGVLSAAVPVSTLGTGAAVAVCFSPEEDCTALAVDAIDRAETEILVNAYGLTTSSSTVEALIRAKQRGVEVSLIADRTTPCGHNSGIGSLVRAGIPIWIGHTARIAYPNP